MAETSNAKFTSPSIPMFDGHYVHWAKLMKNFLLSKEYWSLVQNGVPTGEDQEQNREQKLKDLKIKNYLYQAIPREVLETIVEDDTSKQIWDAMYQKYHGSSKVQQSQLQALKREYELLSMKEGEKVDSYMSRTLAVVNKMKINGEPMEASAVVGKILRSMTTRFNYVVCSIEESHDLSTLSINELHGSLLVHEQRMQGKEEEEHALKVVTSSEGMARKEEVRFGTRGRGRGNVRGRGRGRGRAFNKATIECYNCHNLGHFQYECPNYAHYVEEVEFNEDEEMLLMTYAELKNCRREAMWFLDSGCSNHMSGDKRWFVDLDQSFRHSVKLGNGSKMVVMGKGSVRMLVEGKSHLITEVFYVPELKNNLLSIGQLQEKSLAILIQDNICKIYHSSNGLIMQTSMTTNRMFVLSADLPLNDSKPKCFQATTSDSITDLWHKRFGHLNMKGLRTLAYRKMVTGLPILKASSKVCEECVTGKQQRDSFKKTSTWRASQTLQLIHSDICGPITPESNSGKRYVITFIDDNSRKMWIYFLNTKSEAFPVFKKFKIMVEKESGNPIGCLRTDRGGEFTSLAFNDYCKMNGIRRQLTAAYSPQQNGVAERRNRTIMNMVRCILKDKGVPLDFWPEAVNWAAHILNRCPTSAVNDKTPEEAWSGLKPSVEHFKIFGCIGHVHIPDIKRKKLDNRSRKCVFLGVSQESKAFRMFDPKTKKIIISRDVVFDEEESWSWNQKELESANLEWNNDVEENTSVETSAEIQEPAGNNGSANPNTPPNEEEGEEEQTGSGSSSPSTDSQVTSPSPVAGQVQGRTRRQPTYMNDFVSGEGLSDEEEVQQLVMFASTNDPVTFKEAVKYQKWKEAMNLEMRAIERNDTWELTLLPKEAKAIGLKWLFKTKLNEKGEVDKCKARLVAKGYSQQAGVDYTEVFAPVARWDTIRMILALAASKDWKVFQLDVKSAFLHGEISEEVFVEQPEGYEIKGAEGKVYRLKKALYGLKQAPRAWFSKIEAFFLEEKFEKCVSEPTLFVKNGENGDILIVSLYVDDLIFTGNNDDMFKTFKQSMMQKFEMSDLGVMKYFLGVEVKQGPAGIFISQMKYVKEILERFGMQHCNSVKNPIVPGCKLTKDEGGMKVDASVYKQKVGSLMYLTATRPDIMYVVSLLSRFIESPTEQHNSVMKRVFRYLQGTVELGILYKKKGGEQLVGFTDSDYAGDLDDRKSTSGYVFKMCSSAVAWSSKKQPVVSLSTTEAEFIAAGACACQSVWMMRVLQRIGVNQEKSIIFCDNSSTIKLSKNPVMHGRSKHIDIRFHFLRDLVKDNVIHLEHCGTNNQLADGMTKPLKFEHFLQMRKLLGLCFNSEVN